MRLPSILRSVAIPIFVTVALSTCGGPGDTGEGAGEANSGSALLSEEAQLLVNDGNLAQREGRYEDAARLFGEAMGIHPNHPVPQFGRLLAAEALGDAALSRTLREALATTGPELLNMLGPSGAMGSGGSHLPPAELPEGHPPLDTLPTNPESRSGTTE